MSDASPTVSRYQPCASSRIEQRLGQPVQLLEVARGHPEGPRDAQVRDIGSQSVEGDLAPGPAQVPSKAARERRVVGRVRPARPRRDVRSLVEPVGGERPDRLEHRDARLGAWNVHPAEEALLDEPGQAIEDVDHHAVDRSPRSSATASTAETSASANTDTSSNRRCSPGSRSS